MTLDLFGEKPRRPRRVMMHVLDAGTPDCRPPGDDSQAIARFHCERCGAETDWQLVRTISDAKRGIPCDTCNTPAPRVLAATPETR